MKPIIIPDLHGSLNCLDWVLSRFPERKYILLGDVIDRGPHSRMVISRIRQLNREGRVKMCLGNHEQMAFDAVLTDRPGAYGSWHTTGGAATLTSYHGVTGDLILDLHFLRGLARPVIIEGDVMCTHAMRPPYRIHGEARPRIDFSHLLPLYGRPGIDAYMPLPEGIRFSVHGHEILPEPLHDVENHAYHIDLGGDLTGRFCVFDMETEQVVLKP